jgi:hypothetical protein
MNELDSPDFQPPKLPKEDKNMQIMQITQIFIL